MSAAGLRPVGQKEAWAFVQLVQCEALACRVKYTMQPMADGWRFFVMWRDEQHILAEAYNGGQRPASWEIAEPLWESVKPQAMAARR